VREGRYENRIPESGIDEFNRLARDLNLLSEQFQKERDRRDASMGSFRQTVELLGEGVLTLGPQREVVLMNATTAQILGIDPFLSRGRRLDELLDRDHPVRQLVERLFNGSSGPLSVPVPSEARKKPYVAIGHRISGSDAPAGALIEFKDAEALAEIHLMADHAKVLSRLGQMAAGVAHEIGNPLQTINLELGALRASSTLSPKEVDLHVRTALDEIDRLQRAVSGFLKVARLRPLALGEICLNELLDETREAMETEANLSGLDLELDLEPDLPKSFTDPEVMRQAIQNLVKNAIQAVPSRDGRIRISSRARDGEIRIAIEDSGPGIGPENIDRVFDLYFTTKEGGSGVGLALVRQAVEMHGGEVELRSEPGSGTCVTLRIPLRGSLGREG